MAREEKPVIKLEDPKINVKIKVKHPTVLSEKLAKIFGKKELNEGLEGSIWLTEKELIELKKITTMEVKNVLVR